MSRVFYIKYLFLLKLKISIYCRDTIGFMIISFLKHSWVSYHNGSMNSKYFYKNTNYWVQLRRLKMCKDIVCIAGKGRIWIHKPTVTFTYSIYVLYQVESQWIYCMYLNDYSLSKIYIYRSHAKNNKRLRDPLKRRVYENSGKRIWQQGCCRL